jgi:predicted N-acetyltransferase YhbS
LDIGPIDGFLSIGRFERLAESGKLLSGPCRVTGARGRGLQPCGLPLPCTTMASAIVEHYMVGACFSAMSSTISANLTFRLDSLADPAKRTAWVSLLRDIFGIDFSAFIALGIWPDDYRAFSYLDGELIAANICCNPLPLRVRGRDVLAGQLQGVATRPAYRRQGLFHDLMNRVLAFADTRYEFLLLYTETPVLYQPFGFRLVTEQSFHGRFRQVGTDVTGLTIQPLSVVEPTDISLIRRLFTGRKPISDTLGIIDNEDVFFGNLLLQPGLRLSYLPAFDVLVVWDKGGTDGRQRLIDLVGAAWPPMDVLAAVMQLPTPDAAIDVLFPPDRLSGTFSPLPYIHEDGDLLMVRGPFAVEHAAFMLPLTALS